MNQLNLSFTVTISSLEIAKLANERHALKAVHAADDAYEDALMEFTCSHDDGREERLASDVEALIAAIRGVTAARQHLTSFDAAENRYGGKEAVQLPAVAGGPLASFSQLFEESLRLR